MRWKRALSWILAICICAGFLPGAVPTARAQTAEDRVVEEPSVTAAQTRGVDRGVFDISHGFGLSYNLNGDTMTIKGSPNKISNAPIRIYGGGTVILDELHIDFSIRQAYYVANVPPLQLHPDSNGYGSYTVIIRNNNGLKGHDGAAGIWVNDCVATFKSHDKSARLNVWGGPEAPAIGGSGSSIYFDMGEGTLVAKGGPSAAGLGFGQLLSYAKTERIGIRSGNIVARGGDSIAFSIPGAGISCKYVDISGGNVFAYGGKGINGSSFGGAGISNGPRTPADNRVGGVYITGGNIKAYGRDGGAGIGGSAGFPSGFDNSQIGKSCLVSITGNPTVVAVGSVAPDGVGGGAGIGGGAGNKTMGGQAGEVLIRLGIGGSVQAYGGGTSYPAIDPKAYYDVGDGLDGVAKPVTHGGAGIGSAGDSGFGQNQNQSSLIQIENGKVFARGGPNAAGVGGGSGWNVGEVRISGGTVLEAVGGTGGVGIGGVRKELSGYTDGNTPWHPTEKNWQGKPVRYSGKVYLKGGTITAIPGAGSSGLGGKAVEISGGRVVASGDGDSSGRLADTELSVSGGLLDITGGKTAPAIGGSRSLTVLGGTLVAHGQPGQSAIGDGARLGVNGGLSFLTAKGATAIGDGSFGLNGSGKVYLSSDVGRGGKEPSGSGGMYFFSKTAPLGSGNAADFRSWTGGVMGTTTIADTMEIPADCTLNMMNNPTLIVTGKLINTGKMEGPATVVNRGTITKPLHYVHDISQSDLKVGGGTNVTYEVTGTTDQNRIIFEDFGINPKVTLNGVQIATNSFKTPAIDMTKAGVGTVTLVLKGENTLSAGNDAPAINLSVDSLLRIEGEGSLMATGSQHWPGIGGKDGGEVEFAGGTVKAVGGQYAAGVGGSNGFGGVDVRITGGNLTAVAGQGGNGIGTGFNGAGLALDPGTFTMTGGSVTTSNIQDTSAQASWRGLTYLDGGDGEFRGVATIAKNTTLPAGKSVHIPAGAEVTVATGVTLTNNTNLYVEGKLTLNGTYTGSGKVYRVGGIVDAKIPNVQEIGGTPGMLDVSKGSAVITSTGYTHAGVRRSYTGSYTITGATTENTVTVTDGADVRLTLKNVSMDLKDINEACPLDMRNAGAVTLTLAGENTLTAGNQRPGIYANAAHDMTIEGTGTLTAKGGYAWPGIRWSEGAGELKLRANEITAIGGFCGAGIGGNWGFPGGKVRVESGIVNAVAGGNAAGIGGGAGGGAGSFLLTGGAQVNGNIQDTSRQSLWQGIVGENNVITVWGQVTLQRPLTIASGASMTIPKGLSLTVPAGIKVRNDGTVSVLGTLKGGQTDWSGTGKVFKLAGGSVTGISSLSVEHAPGQLDLSLGDAVISPTGYTYLGQSVVYSGTYTVTTSGSESSEHGLSFANGASVNLILDSVNLNGNGRANFSPLDFGYAGKVTLTLRGDSTVTAGDNHPAIYTADHADLTIRGSGSLRAVGTTSWPGIRRSNGTGTLIIESGTLLAEGGYSGAGIGGNWGAPGGNVVISGGAVTAKAGAFAKGIGGGNSGAGGSTVVSGGVLRVEGGMNGSFSTGTNGSAVVFVGHVDHIEDVSQQKDWSGLFIVGTSGTLYGKGITISEDFTVDQGVSLGIPQGAVLTVGGGVTLRNEGVFGVAGQLNCLGTYAGAGKVLRVSEGTVSGVDASHVTDLSTEPGMVDVSQGSLIVEPEGYYFAGLFTNYTGDYTVTGNPAGYGVTVRGGASANITLRGVNLSPPKAGALNFKDAGDVTLYLEGANEVRGGEGFPGVYLSADTTLTIDGAGSLNASGSYAWPGIGREGGGKLVINGGSIKAYNGGYAAGIGGSWGQAGADVTINGGTVLAQGMGDAQDIGYGFGVGEGGDSGTLTVNGGVVMLPGNGASHAQKNKGIVFTRNDYGDKVGVIYGSNPTVSGDVQLDGGWRLSVPAGQTVTIAEGATLCNYGLLEVKGTLKWGAGLGALTGTGSFVGIAPALEVAQEQASYGSTVSLTARMPGRAEGHTATFRLGTKTLGTAHFTRDGNVASATLRVTLTGSDWGMGEKALSVTCSESDGVQASKPSETLKLTVAGKTLTADMLAAIADRHFTGAAQTPGLTLRDNGKTLTAGQDYTASYSENINVGEATVTVTGSGGYTGSFVAKFKILRSNPDFQAKAASATVTYGDKVVIGVTGFGTQTGTVSLYNTKETATAEAIATAEVEGGVATLYYDTAERKLNIGANALYVVYGGGENLLSGQVGPIAVALEKRPLTAEVSMGSKVYDGTAEFNNVMLLLVGRAAGDDLSATASGTATSAEPGKWPFDSATVEVVGMQSDWYTLESGPVGGVLTIEKKPLTADMVGAIPTQTYTGVAVEPSVVVTDESYTLIHATDYTVRFENNTAVGTATVVVEALERSPHYQGTAEKTFSIGKGEAVVTLAASTAQVVYGDTLTVNVSGVTSKGGTAASGEMTLRAGSATGPVLARASLSGGKATLTHRTADKLLPLGESKVFAVFEGSASLSTGGAELTVTMTVRPLTGVVTEGAGKVYDGKVEMAAVPLTLTNLLPGDIVVATAAGTAPSGVGSHPLTVTSVSLTGTASKYYTLAKGNVSGAVQIKPRPLTGGSIAPIANQTLTGSPITPTPTVTVGGLTLTAPQDFDVVYQRNTNVGTATITVTGKGNFEGTLDATFQIVRISAAPVLTVANRTLTYGEAMTLTVSGLEMHGDMTDSYFELLLGGASGTVIARIPAGDATENPKGTFTMTYKTTEKGLKIGINQLSVRYSGDENLSTGLSGGVSVEQKKLSLTATVASDASKVYDGTTAAARVQLTLGGLLADDEVIATADGTIDSEDVGDARGFTASSAALTGGQSGYYSLAAGNVSGTIAVTPKSLIGGLIAPIPDEIADGTEKKPTPTVTVDGMTLTASDYDVAYENNVTKGMATVTVTGKGNFADTLTAQFRIVPTRATVVLNAPATVGYDSPLVLTVSGLQEHEELENSNFELYVGAATGKPIATIEATDAVEGETGTFTLTYHTARKGLALGENTLFIRYSGDTGLSSGTSAGAAITLTAKALTATVAEGAGKVFDGGTEIINLPLTLNIAQGDDVAATATGSTAHANAGAHAFTASEVTLTGAQSSYYTLNADAVGGNVTISPKPITADMFAAIPTQSYTGTAITPTLTANKDEPIFTEDYTVVWTGNTAAGTASGTITGQHNYGGNATITFAIGKGQSVIGLADGTHTAIYGSELTVAVESVKSAGGALATGEVVLRAGSENGQELARATLEGGGATLIYNTGGKGLPIGDSVAYVVFEGSDQLLDSNAPLTVTVEKKPLTATVAPEASKVYDGTAEVTNVPLTPNALTEDEVVATANGTVAGTAVGSYAFTATEISLTGAQSEYYTLASTDVSGSMTISAKPISADMFENIQSQPYTGTAIEPELTARAGEPISAGDYTVVWTGNTQVGTASGTITGKGNYTDTAQITFQIGRGAPVITLGAGTNTATYGGELTVAVERVKSENGAPATGEVTLRASTNGAELARTALDVNGAATLTYNTSGKGLPIGESRAYVVFEGNDKLGSGTAQCTVTISQKTLTATLPENSAKVYDGTAAFTNIALTLNILEGDAVTATATGNTGGENVGEQTFSSNSITVSGADKFWYTEPAAVSGTVKITPKALVAAMAAPIPDAPFTGKPIEPTPVLTDGTKPLAAGTDYTITKYENNTNQGTAGILLTGKGNYSGDVTLTFNIVEETVEVIFESITGTTYGETLTISILVKSSAGATGSSVSLAAQNTHGEKTHLTDASLTPAEDETGRATLSYDTKGKNLSPTDKLVLDVGAKDITVPVKLSPKPLTATVQANKSKSYDGTAEFTGVPLVLTGVVTGDNVTATANVTAAGTDYGEHSVRASEAKLAGEQSAFYTLSPADVSGSITIAKVEIRADMFAPIATQTLYTGAPITPQLVAREGKPISAADYTVQWTNNLNVGTATGRVEGLDNYYGSFEVFFQITKASATATFDKSAYTVVYGESVMATVTISPKPTDGTMVYVRVPDPVNPGASRQIGNGIAQDGVVIMKVDGSWLYSDEPMPLEAFVLSNDNLNNYITTTGTANLHMTPRPLSLDTQTLTKVYDGNGDFVGVPLLIGNVVRDDDVTATVTGTVEDANAGEKQLNVTALSLNGDTAGHYTLTKPDTLPAEIRKKPRELGSTLLSLIPEQIKEINLRQMTSGEVLLDPELSFSIGAFNDPSGMLVEVPVIEGDIITFRKNGKSSNDSRAEIFIQASARNYEITGNWITIQDAEFAKATAGQGGSVSPSGFVFVPFGEDTTITITPDEGYHIVDVVVNGESKGAITEYTFRRYGGTIHATFAPNIVREGYTVLDISHGDITLDADGSFSGVDQNGAAVTEKAPGTEIMVVGKTKANTISVTGTHVLALDGVSIENGYSCLVLNKGSNLQLQIFGQNEFIKTDSAEAVISTVDLSPLRIVGIGEDASLTLNGGTRAIGNLSVNSQMDVSVENVRLYAKTLNGIVADTGSLTILNSTVIAKSEHSGVIGFSLKGGNTSIENSVVMLWSDGFENKERQIIGTVDIKNSIVYRRNGQELVGELFGTGEDKTVTLSDYDYDTSDPAALLPTDRERYLLIKEGEKLNVNESASFTTNWPIYQSGQISGTILGEPSIHKPPTVTAHFEGEAVYGQEVKLVASVEPVSAGYIAFYNGETLLGTNTINAEIPVVTGSFALPGDTRTATVNVRFTSKDDRLTASTQFKVEQEKGVPVSPPQIAASSSYNTITAHIPMPESLPESDPYASPYGPVEFSLGEDGPWQESNVFNDLEFATQYTVYGRYGGNDKYLPSEPSSVTVYTSREVKEDAEFGYDYEKETIRYIAPPYGVLLVGTYGQVSELNSGDSVSGLTGRTILVKRYAESPYPDTPKIELTIPLRHDTPQVTGGYGAIQGTSTAMEYAQDGVSWQDCEPGTTPVLPGTYQVRMKPVDGKFRSAATSVSVYTENDAALLLDIGNGHITVDQQPDGLLRVENGTTVYKNVSPSTQLIVTGRSEDIGSKITVGYPKKDLTETVHMTFDNLHTARGDEESLPFHVWDGAEVELTLVGENSVVGTRTPFSVMGSLTITAESSGSLEASSFGTPHQNSDLHVLGGNIVLTGDGHVDSIHGIAWVYIGGGTVTIKHMVHPMLVITGGSVTDSKGVLVRNEDMERLSLWTLPIPEEAAGEISVSVDGVPWNICGQHPGDNNIYLWLTQKKHEVVLALDGNEEKRFHYEAKWDGTNTTIVLIGGTAPLPSSGLSIAPDEGSSAQFPYGTPEVKLTVSTAVDRVKRSTFAAMDTVTLWVEKDGSPITRKLADMGTDGTARFTLDTSIWEPGAYILTAVYGGASGDVTIPGSSTAQTAPVKLLLQVTKADTAPPTAPVLKTATDSTLTVETQTGAKYRIDGGAWQDSGEFAGLMPGARYTVSSYFPSKNDKYYYDSPIVSTKLATLPGANAQALTINFREESLTLPGDYAMSLTVDGEEISYDPIAHEGYLSYWLEKGVSELTVYRKASGDIPAGIPATIQVPQRPARPQDVTMENGVLSGVTAQMEYRRSGEAWTACPEGGVSGLEPGVYQVRLAATDASFASETTNLANSGDDALILDLADGDITSTGGSISQNENSYPGIESLVLTGREEHDKADATAVKTLLLDGVFINEVLFVAPGTTLKLRGENSLRSIVSDGDVTVSGLGALVCSEPIFRHLRLEGGSFAVGNNMSLKEVTYTGGSLRLSKSEVAVHSPSGEPLYPLTLPNQWGVESVAVDDVPWSIGANHVADDSLYLYLTPGAHVVTVRRNGDVSQYIVQWNGAEFTIGSESVDTNPEAPGLDVKLSTADAAYQNTALKALTVTAHLTLPQDMLEQQTNRSVPLSMAELTVTAPSGKVVARESAPMEARTGAGVQWTLDASGWDAGDYLFTVSYGGTHGIDTQTATATLSVKPYAVTLTLEGAREVVYDGKAHGLTAARLDGPSPEEKPTVTYCADGEADWSEEPPVNAGTYEVRAQWSSTDSNFADVTIADTLTIKRKTDVFFFLSVEEQTPTTVTLAPVTATYGTPRYSHDGSTWQESNVFEGLRGDTLYTFQAKTPETDNAASYTAFLTLRTPAAEPSEEVLSVDYHTGEVIFDDAVYELCYREGAGTEDRPFTDGWETLASGDRLPLAKLLVEFTLAIRVKATDEAGAGEVQRIAVQAPRPFEGEDVTAADGILLGTTAAMEYLRVSDDRAMADGFAAEWTACQQGQTTVEPGLYRLRLAATAAAFASHPAQRVWSVDENSAQALSLYLKSGDSVEVASSQSGLTVTVDEARTYEIPADRPIHLIGGTQNHLTVAAGASALIVLDGASLVTPTLDSANVTLTLLGQNLLSGDLTFAGGTLTVSRESKGALTVNGTVSGDGFTMEGGLVALQGEEDPVTEEFTITGGLLSSTQTLTWQCAAPKVQGGSLQNITLSNTDGLVQVVVPSGAGTQTLFLADANGKTYRLNTEGFYESTRRTRAADVGTFTFLLPPGTYQGVALVNGELREIPKFDAEGTEVKATVISGEAKTNLINQSGDFDDTGKLKLPEGTQSQAGEGNPVIKAGSGCALQVNGSVYVDTAGTVQVGDGEVIKLPSGGIVDPQGNALVTSGGKIQVAEGPEIPLSAGGTFTPEGVLEVPSIVFGGTAVHGVGDVNLRVNPATGDVSVPVEGTVGPEGVQVKLITVEEEDAYVNLSGELHMMRGGTLQIGVSEVVIPVEGIVRFSADAVLIPTGSLVNGEEIQGDGGSVTPEGILDVTRTVYFYLNDGTDDVYVQETVQNGEIVMAPESKPTREGYDFIGWSQAANLFMEYDFETKVQGMLKLYARWMQQTNTVNFDADGGTPVPGRQVPYGAATAEPIAPEKQGYTFVGWFDEETLYDFQSVVTGPLTLTARWEADEYTVVLQPGNGEALMTHTLTFGQTVPRPEEPTRQHYTFMGWYHDEQTYDFNTPVNVDLALTGKWAPVPFPITYDLAGGTASNPSSYTVESGAIALTPPTRPGYVFTGWTGTDLSEASLTVTIPTGSTGARSYTATWKAEESGGGGGGITPPKPPKNPDGSTTTTVTDPKSGITTITTLYPDGTKVETVHTPEGKVTARITLPKNVSSMVVTIPTPKPPTAVVVAVTDEAGNRKILTWAVPTKDGLRLRLEESTTLEIIENAKEFRDVKAGAWSSEAIAFVTARALFQGTGKDTFSATMSMSRAMLFTVLHRMSGEAVGLQNGPWYADAMAWAKAEGISDGTNPDAAITREQLAVMLYRYAGTPAVADSELTFADGDTASPWAADALGWAVSQGILNGKSNGLLDPGAGATREEVAAMLMRFVVNQTER